jgi:hypothetical protein
MCADHGRSLGHGGLMADWYRVTLRSPTGYQYEMTGQASSEAEAVRLADHTLEYVERVGISIT